MKKSSEDLKQAQEAMDIRRKLLREGEIRLDREKTQPPPKQKEQKGALQETGS